MSGLSRYRRDWRCPDGTPIYECLDCGMFIWDTTRHNERHHAFDDAGRLGDVAGGLEPDNGT